MNVVYCLSESLNNLKFKIEDLSGLSDRFDIIVTDDPDENEYYDCSFFRHPIRTLFLRHCYQIMVLNCKTGGMVMQYSLDRSSNRMLKRNLKNLKEALWDWKTE